MILSKNDFFTNSNNESIKCRFKLFSMLQDYEAPLDEKERSLPLFFRGSLLARILAVDEVYRAAVDTPGYIADFGAWRGLTSVLCENFRSIYEPLNFQRKIYSFDTFEGYKGFSEGEAKTVNVSEGRYAVEEGYEKYLSDLLICHEMNNAMGHTHGKHKVIKGDAVETFDQLIKSDRSLFFSHVFFDMNCYLPTKKVLELVLPRLVTGSVIAFWQLTRPEIEAEGKAFIELFGLLGKYKLHKAKTYPSLCYIIKE